MYSKYREQDLKAHPVKRALDCRGGGGGGGGLERFKLQLTVCLVNQTTTYPTHTCRCVCTLRVCISGGRG